MRAPAGEIVFESQGKRYTLVFDMKAIAFFEREADLSIVDALAALEAASVAGKAPKLSHLAFLMQAGLQRHHPEISAEDAVAFAADPAVQSAMGVGLQAAMPAAEAGAEGKAHAPSGTGTKTSKQRSRRD